MTVVQQQSSSAMLKAGMQRWLCPVVVSSNAATQQSDQHSSITISLVAFRTCLWALPTLAMTLKKGSVSLTASFSRAAAIAFCRKPSITARARATRLCTASRQRACRCSHSSFRLKRKRSQLSSLPHSLARSHPAPRVWLVSVRNFCAHPCTASAAYACLSPLPAPLGLPPARCRKGLLRLPPTPLSRRHQKAPLACD